MYHLLSLYELILNLGYNEYDVTGPLNGACWLKKKIRPCLIVL